MIHYWRVTTPVPTGKRNARMRETVGDMVRSLAVVLGVIGLIMLLTWRPNPDPIREVDPLPQFSLAGGQADFPVVFPQLDGLRATSVRWEPTQYSRDEPVWHVGFVTAEDEYLEITQTSAANEEFLKNELTGIFGEGEKLIANEKWLVFEGPDSRALVKVTPEVTTVVSGTVALPELEAAVKSLTTTPDLE
jgi:hypothetical protein